MKQCVSRRRRCWTLLFQMDPVIHFREGHRSDMFTGSERFDMRRASYRYRLQSGKQRDFGRVAEALINQHQRIHLPENQRRANGKDKNRFKRVENPHTLLVPRKRQRQAHPAAENRERVPISQASPPLRITISTDDEDLDESCKRQ